MPRRNARRQNIFLCNYVSSAHLWVIRTPNDSEKESSDSYNGAGAGFNCQNRQPAARNPPNAHLSSAKTLGKYCVFCQSREKHKPFTVIYIMCPTPCNAARCFSWACACKSHFAPQKCKST